MTKYFLVRHNFSFFYTAVIYNEHSMEIMKFTLILLCQKFRESNVFTKELIWRNIFSVRVKVSFSHTVMWKLMNSSFTNLFTKILWNQQTTLNQFFLQRNFFIFFFRHQWMFSSCICQATRFQSFPSQWWLWWWLVQSKPYSTLIQHSKL